MPIVVDQLLKTESMRGNHIINTRTLSSARNGGRIKLTSNFEDGSMMA